MEIRCELNRTDRPTPQSWSPLHFLEFKNSERPAFHLSLTNIKTALQLLTNGHQLYSRPKFRSQGLGNSEGPTSTIYIPPIFPDRLETLLKEIYRLSHLDIFNRGVVIVSPEVLHTLNLRAELLQSSLICAIFLLVLLLSEKLLELNDL